MAENLVSSGKRSASVAPASRKRRATAEQAPRQRSAVTNGQRLFIEGDDRTAFARRFRDLVALHSEDLGGPELLSAAQCSLIRRVATMEVELEKMEGQLSAGAEVDLDLYARTASHLRRHLETLGIERVRKDITPSPRDYLAGLAAERARRAADDAETADEPSDAEKRAGGPATPRSKASGEPSRVVRDMHAHEAASA